MNATLKQRVEMLAKNREVFAKSAKWNYHMLYPVAALIYTGEGKMASEAKISESKKILKANEGPFTSFRNNLNMMTIAKMSLADDPKKYLNDTQDIYKKLKAGRIFGNDYTALTAIGIADLGMTCKADEIAEKTNKIMKAMNKIHPILTNDEDMVLASLLALKTDPVDQIIEDTEACYLIMKSRFHDLNAVQSLGHVMALQEGKAEEKCERVSELFDAFKALKRRYPTDACLPTLGALLSVNMDADALAKEIVEAADYLKTFKGFGNFSMGSKLRLVLASLLAVEVFAGDKKTANFAAYTSILTMVIAMEVAYVATISATTAAATSH